MSRGPLRGTGPATSRSHGAHAAKATRNIVTAARRTGDSTTSQHRPCAPDLDCNGGPAIKGVIRSETARRCTMRKSIGITAVALLAAGLLSGTSSALAAAPPALPAAHVWVTTPDGSLRMADRGATPFHQGGVGKPDDHRRPEPGVPAHGRLRRVDHRLVRAPCCTGSARQRATPRCATCSADRGRAGRPAPADGRLGLRRRPALHLRRPAGRRRPTTRMQHFSHRARPAQILPLLRQALALNPRAEGRSPRRGARRPG